MKTDRELRITNLEPMNTHENRPGTINKQKRYKQTDTQNLPIIYRFDAFTLLIREKNVAIYAFLRCKIFSLKIWVCKIFDKFHV